MSVFLAVSLMMSIKVKKRVASLVSQRIDLAFYQSCYMNLIANFRIDSPVLEDLYLDIQYACRTWLYVGAFFLILNFLVNVYLRVW